MTGAYACLLVMAIVILFPVYWMVAISFKNAGAIYREPTLLPSSLTFANYVTLFVDKHFLIYVGNSLIVACSATVISVFISALAAYSLVRLKYRFRDWIGRLILFSYLTPSALLFIPLAVIMARLHLGNTREGLTLVYLTFATPLSTWMLMGFFRGIPLDLEEQALVDGTTMLGALLRIVLPLSAPGLVAVAVFTFSGAWSELLLALVLMTSPDKQTVPVALQEFIVGDVFLWGPIMAGSVISAIPVMILYFAGQRFLVQGLAAGAVKG
ncbi:MAG: carbohydrate ABC transporter permease [Chloroflexota bacterium]